MLAVENGKALLISEKALDCQPYNTDYTHVTWETCTLRQWLNSEFLNAAFNTTERSAILTTTVTADKDPDYDTDPGNDTQDRMFLLSTKEADKYFKSDEDRKCAPTAYAEAQGVYGEEGFSYWWLRSLWSETNFATIVDNGGSDSNYSNVDNTHRGVRPALWIELSDSSNVAASEKHAETTESRVETEQAVEDAAVCSDIGSAVVGDRVEFGAYEQDDDESNGKEKIRWRVLAVENGKALLISEKALDYQGYNTHYASVTWETCTLRQWLNDDFLNEAFSTTERSAILTTTVTADKNPYYNTDPGNDTKDQVFLLSIIEAEKYLSSSEDKRCIPTPYTKAQGAAIDSKYGGTCSWWLRSPGYNSLKATYVHCGGGIFGNSEVIGSRDDYKSGRGVRPALWVDLGSEIFRS